MVPQGLPLGKGEGGEGMTVRELIAELQKQDPDKTVLVHHSHFDTYTADFKVEDFTYDPNGDFHGCGGLVEPMCRDQENDEGPFPNRQRFVFLIS